MKEQRQITSGMLATFAFCGEVAAAGAAAYLMMWRYERDDAYLFIGITLGASAALWLLGVWRWGKRAQAQLFAVRSEDLLGKRANEWARRGVDRRRTDRTGQAITGEPV